jgi:1-acyl-sn-glycerol-3-phosphate acyltransferase
MTRRRTNKPRTSQTPRKKARPRKRAARVAEQPVAADVVEAEPDSSEELELGIGSRVIPPDVAFTSVGEELPPRKKSRLDPDVEAQIRALEARLDGLIQSAGGDIPAGRSHVTAASPELVETLSVGDQTSDAVRELIASDYYKKKWGRLGMRDRGSEVDDFGLDPAFEERLRPLLDFIYKRWFRIETTGVDNIPAEGRCLVVANHSGTLPLDGVMLRTAIRLEHPSRGELRWLAEDFIYYLPFVGAFMNRIGAVRACQENAERLLDKDSLVAVFPEGVKGIGKLYGERYKLQRFGRGGFIRLALRTQTPIIPCAIVGAEESNPMLYRIEYLSKAVGLPYFPVTPTFPALGPLGLLPAPTKWQIQLGEPLGFEGYGPEAADDHVLVGRLAERVRASIQRMVDEGVKQRQSVWLG